jgi:alpha-tubulin suppressor-like RCC1 family protein
MEFNEIAQGGLNINGLAIIAKRKLRGLYVSGLNDYGQVGDGTTEFRYKPQLINSSLVEFSAGLRHCLAINQSKELYAWGQNLNGRLGDGTEDDRYVPTKIGSATNWEEVACGWNFSLAINSLGELYSWGNNIAGNLGYEPRTDVLEPTKIGIITTYKVTINTGTNDFGTGNKFYLNGKVSPSITLKEGKTYRFDQSDVSNASHPLKFSTTSNGTHASGTAFTTGVTSVGTPGTSGSYVEIIVPIGVADLYYYCQNHAGMGGSLPTIVNSGDNWTKVVAGRHVLAINSSGELYSWGENEFGQLGDGLSGGTISRSAATKIGVENNWVEIAAGYDHTLAINSDGELWACGRNDYGQLGDETQTNKSTLVQIKPEVTWVKIAAGRDHSLAVSDAGELYSWGRNQSGYYQLGLDDETESVRTSPQKIGDLTDWTDVAAGFHHSIALNSSKQIYGFGYNGYGSLGDGTNASRSSPVVINFIENNLQVKAGGYVTINFVYSNFENIASGGIKASGLSWYSSGVPIEGGALLSGQANINSILLENQSTMSLVGGSANISLIISKTIESNGISLSGDSKIAKIFETFNGEGGASLNGIAIQGFSVVVSGGTECSGTAVCFKITGVDTNEGFVIASGQAQINVLYEFDGNGGVINSGRGVIGIQPKVSGGISVEGSSINFKIIRPIISGGVVANGSSLIKFTYNVEKYKRGQGRVGGKARKEKLRKLTKSVMHNVGLSMEAPNILNVPPVDPNALIVPKGNETPTLDPNSYRIQHYPGWCEFNDPCVSAYVPAVVKKRQGKYMPEKKSDAVVKPGVQLATLTQQ